MPTTVQLTQPADLAKLKCLFFNMVKELKEISWYDIKCNKEKLLENIKKALAYIILLNSKCPLSHSLDCEISSFIKKQTSFCIYEDSSCGDTQTIVDGPING